MGVYKSPGRVLLLGGTGAVLHRRPARILRNRRVSACGTMCVRFSPATSGALQARLPVRERGVRCGSPAWRVWNGKRDVLRERRLCSTAEYWLVVGGKVECICIVRFEQASHSGNLTLLAQASVSWKLCAPSQIPPHFFCFAVDTLPDDRRVVYQAMQTPRSTFSFFPPLFLNNRLL